MNKMRYCTYCKIFKDELNQVMREDDVYELYDKHEPIRHVYEQDTYKYICNRCGSVYTGIP